MNEESTTTTIHTQHTHSVTDAKPGAPAPLKLVYYDCPFQCEHVKEDVKQLIALAYAKVGSYDGTN